MQTPNANDNKMRLHEVFSVTATAEDDVYALDVHITDAAGEEYRCDYVSRPDDPFGLNPTIRQWLVDNIGKYEIAPYVPPVPGPPNPTTPQLVASGVFTVADGWLESVGAAAGIGMAFAVDVGTYWLLFSDPQPDLAYAAPASSSHGQINVQRHLDYVVITVSDASGGLIDPAEFSITIMRAL